MLSYSTYGSVIHRCSLPSANTTHACLHAQMLVIKEFFAIAREAQKDRSLPGFRAQQWYFFLVAMFYLYGRCVRSRVCVGGEGHTCVCVCVCVCERACAACVLRHFLVAMFYLCGRCAHMRVHACVRVAAVSRCACTVYGT